MSETLIILSAGAICLMLIVLCKPRAADAPVDPREAEVKRLRRGYFALWAAAERAMRVIEVRAPESPVRKELDLRLNESLDTLFDLSVKR